MQCKPLSELEVMTLCEKAKGVLMGDNNIQLVKSPLTIYGDIHGQFMLLLNFFPLEESGSRVLFCQTVTFVVALKVRYPQRITILQGNHESRQDFAVKKFLDQEITVESHEKFKMRYSLLISNDFNN